MGMLIFAMNAPAAWAAPFCVVVQGIPPQCMYHDARECWQRANQLHGVCNPNPEEITLPAGSNRFCFVDSSRASQCIYPDRGTCNRDAASKGGACIDNRDVNPVQPDPYQADPQVRY